MHMPHLSGWRATAAFNTLLATVLFVLLLTLLIVSSRQAGGIYQASIFFDGDCERADSINVCLHLLLNIASAGILASSNYFMQVLISPTRAEVDGAHLRRHWLHIGTPSLQNLRYVSKTKRRLWFCFFVTSIPIHLFFNSVVFGTHFVDKDNSLTIASENFLRNGSYYAPGASLTIPGSQWLYGNAMNATDLLNRSSDIWQSIAKTSIEALAWTRLSPSECNATYLACGSSRSYYRNVVVVVNTNNEMSTSGWRRSEAYTAAFIDTAFWDKVVPADELNTLWFAGQCSMKATGPTTARQCVTSCGHALGSTNAPWPITSNDWQRNFSPTNWTINFFSPSDPAMPFDPKTNLAPKGFNQGLSSLNVRYCLAEVAPKTTCKVGILNPILLLMIAFILLKLLLCFLVLRLLHKEDFLVTLGDAIMSFISNPDPTTRNVADLLPLVESGQGNNEENHHQNMRSGIKVLYHHLRRILKKLSYRPYVMTSSRGEYYSLDLGNILRPSPAAETLKALELPLCYGHPRHVSWRTRSLSQSKAIGRNTWDLTLIFCGLIHFMLFGTMFAVTGGGENL